MQEFFTRLEQLWNSLPGWLHDAILLVLGATGATLISFYKDALSDLLKRLWEFLQSLGSTRWHDRAFEKAYIDWVVAKHKDLKLVGVQAQTKLPLEDVFVSLRIRIDRTIYPSIESRLVDGADSDNSTSVNERTLSIGELMRAAQKTVILGDPGSGKTTLLQYVALTFAREKAGDKKLRKRGLVKERLDINKWKLPIFVPLRVVPSAEGFRNWPQLLQLSPHLKYPDGYFERQLEKGRCILLLDGLDETKTQDDQKLIVKAISDLASPPYSNNHMIVTCRIAGWKDLLASEFARLEVKDFNSEEVRRFILHWYDAVERSMVIGKETETEKRLRQERTWERSNDLFNVLARNPRVRRLARNPLLLSIIAIVHRTRVVLPRQRAKLYRECVELLLEQWDIARGIQIDDTGLSLDQKILIMRHIAYNLQESGSPQASRMHIENIIKQQLVLLGKNNADVSRLLSLLEERSGLIVERSFGTLSFAHLTFQEYFAAQAIAADGRKTRDLLEPRRLFDPKWREVLLLYVGIIEDATEFIEAIYSPENENIFYSRLCLAARCLNDALKVTPGLREELLHQLATTYSATDLDFLKRELGDVIESIDNDELLEVITQFVGFPEGRKPVGVADGSSPVEIEALFSQLKNLDAEIRLKALRTLGEIQTASRSVEGFMSALSDTDFDVKTKAITLISERQEHNQGILDAVIKLAGEKEWRIRQRAMKSLGNIGFLSIEASKVLIVGLNDSEGLVACSAALSLGKLGQSTDEVNQALKKSLNSSSIPLQIESARALLRLGQKEKAIFDALQRILENSNWAYRMAVIEILSHEEVRIIGNDTLIRNVASCIDDVQWQVRVYALDAIGRWKHQSSEAISLVISRLTDESKEVREQAILTLVNLEYDLDKISDQLQKMLADQDENVRARVVEAIGNLENNKGRWIRGLMDLAKNESSPLVKSVLIGIISKWKVTDDNVLEMLIDMLDERNILPNTTKRVRDVAFEALLNLSSETGLWIDRQMLAAKKGAVKL